MTERKAAPTAPGPLEDYAAQFDDLWAKAAQRESFRAYLQGLLLPRDRNKTLTGLVGAQPIEDAQHSRVQRLQYFLSESPGTVQPSTPAAWSCSSMTLAHAFTRRES
jgi:SRSO17 transposase